MIDAIAAYLRSQTAKGVAARLTVTYSVTANMVHARVVTDTGAPLHSKYGVELWSSTYSVERAVAELNELCK